MRRLARIGYRHLVAHLVGDAFDFRRRKTPKFHVGAVRADRLGARPIILDDVILDAVHVGQPLFPILRVALHLEARAAHVLFQFEWPAAHGMLFVVVRVLIEIFFGIDEVRRMGQHRQK